MKTIRVKFENSQGELLSARLELPLGQKAHNFVLFAHCFTCNKNLNAIRNISQALTQKGMAVLRFDFTGLGESEGEFADTNFSSNVQDLISAADFLSREYQAPSILIGHSLGGAAVLAAKEHLTEVKAVATIGAPYEPEHVTHLFQGSSEEIYEQGRAEVNLGGRNFTIKKQFLEDIENVRNHHKIKELGAALLVLHSPQDETVSIDNASHIFKSAQHPRSFISLDGADHLMSRKADSLYVGETIASWATRYIEIPEEKELRTKHEVVGRITTELYRVDMKAGKHSLIADEPEKVGGQDIGPDPYDYLLAALGACTAMTLRMYADRKGWDLQEVLVHLSQDKIYAKDCESCETKEGKIDSIDRVIELEGNLSEEEIKRLLEIADRCPVHRTLHSEVKVNTSLEGRG